MMTASVYPSIPLWQLAEIVPPSPPPGTSEWLQVLLYVVGIAFFIVKGISEVKALFGRKPSMQQVIEGMATVPQIKEVHERIDEVKTEMHNRLKEMSTYTHEAIHGLGDRLQVGQLAAQERHEHLMDEVSRGVRTMSEELVKNFKELDYKRSQSVGVAHRDVGDLRDRVSAVEAVATATVQSFHQLDSKMDNLKSLLMQQGHSRSARS